VVRDAERVLARVDQRQTFGYVPDDGVFGRYELNPAYFGGGDDEPIMLISEGIRPPVRQQLEPVEGPVAPGEDVAGREQPPAEVPQEVEETP
jgi:hypothetical protein